MPEQTVASAGACVEGETRKAAGPGLPDAGTVRARAAGALLGRLDALVDDYLARLWDDPELVAFARGELREPAREVAAGDIGRELAALRDGLMPVSCPPELAASVALAVRIGFPLSGVLHCYRTGHAVQWDAYVAEVEALALDTGTRAAALREGSEFLFEYGNRCARWAQREYERARDGDEQRRLEAVRRVLDGSEDVLEGWPLDGPQFAVVARGPVTAAAGALVIRAGAETWTWSREEPGAGGVAGIGGPGDFRAAHREAAAALRVAERLGRPARFADVAPEALALADEPAARAFVAAELGPLAADDDARAEALRATLGAWFAADQTVAAAAARLGVHERTVRNRLRAVAEMTGAEPGTRRVELETALRLLPLLRG